MIAAVLVLAAAALCAAYYTSRQGPSSPDVVAADLITGVATLDQNGEATVTVPSSFIAQHTDFAYQVKTTGAPMPNLYLKSEIHDDRFTIAGGAPGEEVAWQLMGASKAP